MKHIAKKFICVISAMTLNVNSATLECTDQIPSMIEWSQDIVGGVETANTQGLSARISIQAETAAGETFNTLEPMLGMVVKIGKAYGGMDCVWLNVTSVTRKTASGHLMNPNWSTCSNAVQSNVLARVLPGHELRAIISDSLTGKVVSDKRLAWKVSQWKTDITAYLTYPAVIQAEATSNLDGKWRTKETTLSLVAVDNAVTMSLMSSLANPFYIFTRGSQLPIESTTFNTFNSTQHIQFAAKGFDQVGANLSGAMTLRLNCP